MNVGMTFDQLMTGLVEGGYSASELRDGLRKAMAGHAEKDLRCNLADMFNTGLQYLSTLVGSPVKETCMGALRRFSEVHPIRFPSGYEAVEFMIDALRALERSETLPWPCEFHYCQYCPATRRSATGDLEICPCEHHKGQTVGSA